MTELRLIPKMIESLVVPPLFKVDPTPHDWLRLVLKNEFAPVAFGDANALG